MNCKAKDCSIAYYIYYDYIRILDVYANDAIYCVQYEYFDSGLVITHKLMTVYLYISSQQCCPPAPTTESTQFPRGQKCHRRHICIGKTIQVDTAQFLSRRQQKETSGRHGLGWGISRWSRLSENFDFCLDGCLYFSPKLVFCFGGGQVGAARKHPYKGGIEAFQTTKQHQSTKTNHWMIKE